MKLSQGKHKGDSNRLYSKKDIGLGMVIWIPLLAALISIGFAAVLNPWLDLLSGLFILLSFFNLFAAYFWFGTYYVFKESYLYVRCGPFRQRISYDKITEVKESRDPSSAAACSLKRIEIKYGKYDTTLVSPKERDEFINKIRSRCNCKVLVKVGN